MSRVRERRIWIRRNEIRNVTMMFTETDRNVQTLALMRIEGTDWGSITRMPLAEKD
jgi:hypothetical protein